MVDKIINQVDFVNMTINDQKTIFGYRLKQARTMCGLSLRGLEEKIAGTVSYNALNKYEKGEMMPGSDVLMAVAEATKQTAGFFFRPLKGEIQSIKFRKKTKLGKKAQDSIRERALDFFERYLEVESIVGLDSKFENPLHNIKEGIRTPEEAEKAADHLRKTWKLGRNALPNLHETLENNRIKVFEADSDDAFDGFSGWLDGTPVVVIAKRLNKQCLTRKRNTFAHELGHVLLKDALAEDISEKEEERIVHRFSAALLLPKEVFFEEFGKNRKSISLEELINIKITYGISIAAIVFRAHDFRSINDAAYSRFWKVYNTQGWRQKEPGDDDYQGNESSMRFKQLVWRGLSEELITRSKAAELLNVPVDELRKPDSVFS